ncbi:MULTISPECIES: hypothetical protein [Streptacidiphilus]|uniref:Uncharacterized protein n=1 Tax=Streptacidiphilus cavernicola TaxID=3342716 RepID=A0ABV6UW26_9ACTN|nr:hypothetical protein [Streptacidiphilus jeojiense]
MSVPVLPGLPGPLPPVLVAAVAYAGVGLGYLALAGTDLPERMRPEHIDGEIRLVDRAAWTAVVLALALLLWPVGPFLRVVFSGPIRRRFAAVPGWLRGTAEPERSNPAADALSGAGIVAPSAEQDRWVPHGFGAGPDFSRAVAQLVAACEQERLVDAVFLASALVDETAVRCGPDHPRVLDAMELLAHVAHLAGDQGRCVSLNVHVAGRRAWHYGVDHPGARTALRNAYAAWLSASDQVALRTGVPLVTCLRLVAGHAATATVSTEDRLRALQALHRSGW